MVKLSLVFVIGHDVFKVSLTQMSERPSRLDYYIMNIFLYSCQGILPPFLMTTNAFLRYEFWVHCIFIVLAPWISIAVMNAAMVFTIAKTKRKGFITLY